FLGAGAHPRLHAFPTRRSSDLIGGLDRRRVGRPLDPEQLVKIVLHCGHRMVTPPQTLTATGAVCTGGGQVFHQDVQPLLLSSSTSENSASTTSSSPADPAEPCSAPAPPGDAAAAWSFS